MYSNTLIRKLQSHLKKKIKSGSVYVSKYLETDKDLSLCLMGCLHTRKGYENPQEGF